MLISLDQLRRMQATLQRRVQARDADNILAVGFAPLSTSGQAVHPSEQPVGGNEQLRDSAPPATLPLIAQFDVRRKRKNVAQTKRIQTHESLRLYDREAHSYDHYRLATDVEQIGTIVPTGVHIRSVASRATTSLVVRWTTIHPVPATPVEAVEDPRWRWGVLTVSHLFTHDGVSSRNTTASLERVDVCGAGPQEIRGRLAARGRIPGGPDVAVVETGLDRLWLSGFLSSVDSHTIAVARERDLTRWTIEGTTGQFITAEQNTNWRWKSFYPSLFIPQLGRLKHVVQYSWEQPESEPHTEPFRPGTSGGLLMSAGIPIGIQIAAIQPDFKIGYAQCFDTSLPWLTAKLHATSLAIVQVVDRVGL